MPDLSHEQCNTTEPDSSVPIHSSIDSCDFHYPQLCLQASFDSLLSHSYPSTRTTSIKMSSLDHQPNSLGESWTSLDDTEYDDDLQSENTDVGSLIDAHSAEDVHSVADDTFSETEPPEDEDEDSDDEENEGMEIDQNHTGNQNLPSQTLADMEASNLITRSSFSEVADCESDDLEYSCSTTSPNDELNHTVRPSSKDSISRIRVGSTYLSVSHTRAKVSRVKPFEVALLFERPEMHRWKHEIISKLGAALVFSGHIGDEAVPSTSHYHIVPTEFGPGSNSDYAELIPIEAQMAVRSCTFSSQSLSNDQFDLCLEGEGTCTKVLASWPSEDCSPRFLKHCQWDSRELDILCITDDRHSRAKRSRDLMHAFLEQNQKPYIIILIHFSQPRDLTAGPPRRLTPKDSTRPPNIFKDSRNLSGIHLDEFLDLDADILNRHIAYLISNSATQKTTAEKDHGREPRILRTDKFKPRTHVMKGYGSNYFLADSKREYISRHLFIAFIILIAVTLGLNTCKALYNNSNKGIDITGYPSEQKMPRFSSAASILPDSTSGDLSNRMLSTRVPALQNQTENDSSRFQLEIVGDCHLIVRAPKFSKSKKKNGLMVQIARGETSLPVVVQELFDDVYSVELNPEDSFGNIEVSLTTRKPSRTETISVNLGNEPKQQVMWRDAIQRADDHISEMLEMLSNSIKQFETSKAKDNVLSDLRSRFTSLTEYILKSVEILEHHPVTQDALDKLRWLEWNTGSFIHSEADSIKRAAIDIARSSSSRGKTFVHQSSKFVEDSVEYLHKLGDNQDWRGGWHSFREKIGTETMAKVQQRAQRLVQQILTTLRH